MEATIKDVAKLAGVSVATISRVLNNSAVVSPETAEKVNEAIKELNYRPNFLGRNLRKRETNVILALGQNGNGVSAHPLQNTHITARYFTECRLRRSITDTMCL